MRAKANLKTNSDNNGVAESRPPAPSSQPNCATQLTRAELRVLALVAQAKTNKEIAHDLAIRPATVKRHLENLLHKIGARNRVEAAIYAIAINGCGATGNGNCALQSWRDRRQSNQATSAAWAV